jgi:hypothetical protein
VANPLNIGANVQLPPGSLLGPQSPQLQQAVAALEAQLGPILAQLRALQQASGFSGEQGGQGVAALGAPGLQGTNAGLLSGVPIEGPPVFGFAQGAGPGGVSPGGTSIYGFGNSLGNGFPESANLNGALGIHFGTPKSLQSLGQSTGSSGSTGSTGFVGNMSFGGLDFANTGAATGAPAATGSKKV